MAKKAAVVELPTREELVELAKEVNAVLNLDAPIKFGKKVSDDDLIEAIKKECTNNVFEIDFVEDPEDPAIPIYSEVQKEIFGLLNIAILVGEPNGAPVAEEVEEEPEIEETEAPEPVATKTKADKKQKATSDAVASSKTQKEVAVKGETAAKKEKPVKASKSEEEKYTRSNAFTEVLLLTKKTPMPKKEIVEKIESLYINQGGNPIKYMADNIFRYSMPTLVELGHVTKTGSNFQYVG